MNKYRVQEKKGKKWVTVSPHDNEEYAIINYEVKRDAGKTVRVTHKRKVIRP